MSFPKALPMLVDLEGGYEETNDPQDPGGDTYAGIRKVFYSGAWPPDKEAVANYYYAKYWTPAHCDQLPEPTDAVMFQLAVNLGVKAAVQCLQCAVGAYPDGVWGPQTKAATEVIGRDDFPYLILATQRMYYLYHDRESAMFDGLLNRCKQVLEALKYDRI